MSCDSEPLSMRGRIVPVFCVSGCSHIMFSSSLIYMARPGYMKVGGTIAYHILSLSFGKARPGHMYTVMNCHGPCDAQVSG